MIDPTSLLVLMILASGGLIELCRRINDRQRKARGEK